MDRLRFEAITPTFLLAVTKREPVIERTGRRESVDRIVALSAGGDG